MATTGSYASSEEWGDATASTATASDSQAAPVPPAVVDPHVIVIGRNPRQWEECCSPMEPETRIKHGWVDMQTKQMLQMYNPLDSGKHIKWVEVPLQAYAKDRNVFIPRQRVLFFSRHNRTVNLWLYNLSDEIVKVLKNKLSHLFEWHQRRSGFLHHLLAQKMGLFVHTRGSDIQSFTKSAAKHCSSLQDAINIVKYTTPPSPELSMLSPASRTPSRFKSPASVPISLETVYLGVEPHGNVGHGSDPVKNHGQQLREFIGHQQKQMDQKDLLMKVFGSWQRQRGGGGGNVPVSFNRILSLKRIARLLHYCCHPLQLQQPTPIDASAESSWFEKAKEELLASYTSYLTSLGFHPIIERLELNPSHRGSLRYGRAAHSPLISISSSAPPKLYKCLQRSWSGGIMLTELTFHKELFVVKLLTLENSRFENPSPVIGSEARSLFTLECARYMDFIHVHSFMHDFHLTFLLSLLKGDRPFPDNFDLQMFLNVFMKHNRETPSFSRSRITEGSMSIPVNVSPSKLFHHILAHSNVFGAQTLQLCTTSDPSSIPRPEDVALLIPISSQSIGVTTTPQISKLLQETKNHYSVCVLVLYQPQAQAQAQAQATAATQERLSAYLTLSFYLLLVNKNNHFPRLTCDSPHLSASCHRLPEADDTLQQQQQQQQHQRKQKVRLSPHEGEETTLSTESELYFTVREHRRKLGLGSFSSSSDNQLTLDSEELVQSQMRALEEHLKGIASEAQANMRRDGLWKRMLYARPKSDPKPSPGHLEPLSFNDFHELMQLVTVCSLESLDSRLVPFKRQSKRWFRKLMRPLEMRFSEDVRIYTSENDYDKYAAIINPNWQDMLVVVQSDKDGRHQGFYAVYRKPHEGGVPLKERTITAHVEADRQHVETVLNFTCSFLWANIADASFIPSQTQHWAPL